MKKKKYRFIERALREGYLMHGFSSGGRLRVLTLKRSASRSKKRGDEAEHERRGELLAQDLGIAMSAKEFYGESCDLYEALRILNDDVEAGGRKYKDVYGPIEDHYLTGSYAVDEIDGWVGSGRNFDASFKNGEFIIDMSMEEDIRTPQPILDRVFKGETVRWKSKSLDKYTYLSEPTKFADNSYGCSTSTSPSRNGLEGRVLVKRIAKGASFESALKNAIEQTKPVNHEWYEI